MEKENKKMIYVPPVLEIIQVKMEQSIAAGSAPGSVQPGAGSGVQEQDWTDGGSETSDPSGQWW